MLRSIPSLQFLGLPFSPLPPDRALQAILAACSEPAYRYVVTPNAQHVVTVHEDGKRLLSIYRDAFLSLCDSQIIRALAALRGRRLPLVTGSDLVASLLEQQNDPALGNQRKKLLIVGPSDAVRDALRERFPHLDFDVLPAPHGLAASAELRQQVAQQCAGREWDILLLSVGFPQQELIAAELAQIGRPNGVALCAGAAVDFLVGTAVRAPRWMQRLGLEWAFRLVTAPRRMWRRYLLVSPRVFGIFLGDLLGDRP